jgi:septal ring factor EnvC (AmiA/AmiB activator)
MEDETILVELKHINDSINDIKTRFEKFEHIPVALKDIENANQRQDERMARAEEAIKEGYNSRKRIYDRIDDLEKSLKDLGEKPIKEKAEIVNAALKYAGVAVLGGALAFILNKLGVLFK